MYGPSEVFMYAVHVYKEGMKEGNSSIHDSTYPDVKLLQDYKSHTELARIECCIHACSPKIDT